MTRINPGWLAPTLFAGACGGILVERAAHDAYLSRSQHTVKVDGRTYTVVAEERPSAPPPDATPSEPERLFMVSGPNAFPLGNGWALTLDEPVQDPVVSSTGLVTLRGKLTNLREEQVRTFEFRDFHRAWDDFGNTYWSSTGQYHHGIQTLYPGESSRDREVEWVFGRPVPGATVVYEFGLEKNGRTGAVKKHWPKETKP